MRFREWCPGSHSRNPNRPFRQQPWVRIRRASPVSLNSGDERQLEIGPSGIKGGRVASRAGAENNEPVMLGHGWVDQSKAPILPLIAPKRTVAERFRPVPGGLGFGVRRLLLLDPGAGAVEEEAAFGDGAEHVPIPRFRSGGAVRVSFESDGGDCLGRQIGKRFFKEYAGSGVGRRE